MSGEQLELRVAWQHHIGRSPAADRAYESVLSRHREASRHYHGVRHLTWVVRHVLGLSVGRPVADLGAIVGAAFYHDAVYDARAAGNERASAALATEELTQVGWPTERTRRTAAMILATQHLVDRATDVDGGDDGDAVAAAADDLDTSILIAADLAILAADPTAYGDYVRNVRAEYAHLSDEAWTVGRRTVVDRFLALDRLFPPALDLSGWERRARANLVAERATLD